jgi:hypothetical protein
MHADDGSGFLPQCASLLRRLKEPLFHDQQQLLHPLAIFNRRWANVERATSAVLDALDSWSAQTEKADDQVRDLLKAQKDFLYDTTELIEDFEKNFRRSVIPPDGLKKSPFSLSKGLRNHVVMQCNKMKHEHAYLGFVEVQYQFGKILGYSVFALVDPGTLGPDKNVHQQRQAFSFAIEIRKVIANIYLLAEEVAADLIAHSTLDTGASPIRVSAELKIFFDALATCPNWYFLLNAQHTCQFLILMGSHFKLTIKVAKYAMAWVKP